MNALAPLLLLAAAGADARAELELSCLFADHMVLLRDADVPVWGRASPGARVRVRGSWDDAAVEATAGPDGAWSVRLPTPGAGGPHELVVAAGAAEVRIADVLIGEVWLASGQSNMEWRVRADPVELAIDAWEQELANADRPRIRVFDVANTIGLAPATGCGGSWTVATPATAADFSAIAFLFADVLERELDVPVGIVTSDWGGTRIEAWISPDALAARPATADERELLRRIGEDPARAEEALADLRAAWWDRVVAVDPGSRTGWERTDLDDGAWARTALPATWEASGIPGTAGFDGIAWYRRTVELPAGWSGQELVLELGSIDDMDAVWFDGVEVGAMQEELSWRIPRRYTVPAALARPGPRTIAVRVADAGGEGGIRDGPLVLSLRDPVNAGGALSLEGEWRFALGTPLADAGAWPRRTWQSPSAPGVLYDGMIAPLVPFAVRGFLWYQGEANVSEPREYRELLPLLIRDWRARFGSDDLPFYYVQIAPFRYGVDGARVALLRDAQRRALAVPGTGMAVTMDVGDPRDIHPRAKRPVAERLARLALARTYGRAGLVDSGPLYRSMRVEEGRVRISFDHTDGGLVARGDDAGRVGPFALAGADGVFHPAEGEIDGDTVVVWSDAVPRPTAVRYAPGDADEPNLFNGAGLPAASFCTDD